MYKNKKYRQGFTLMELLLVIAILGILTAIAIPKYGDFVNETKKNEAAGEMRALRTALSTYFTNADDWPVGSFCAAGTGDTGINELLEWEFILRTGINPSTGELISSTHTWSGPYISKIPEDPWGRPYIFRVYNILATSDPSDDYKTAIVCTGPTGQLLNCPHGNPPLPAMFSKEMKSNHLPNKSGVSIVYNPPATCTEYNRSDYNIYLWLE